jgi:hypothetical protein
MATSSGFFGDDFDHHAMPDGFLAGVVGVDVERLLDEVYHGAGTAMIEEAGSAAPSPQCFRWASRAFRAGR